ncbi:beta-taxilin [Leuresthes tenuis]|uniref:beta-taxilin n=1 Tax=Leuresthes tenuis TaxID=355514 RepID=UPI003B50B43D
METSMKAAEVLVPPQPEQGSSLEAAARPSSSSDTFDPMVEFRRRLDDIISVHGSTVDLLDKQSAAEAEVEQVKEAKGDLTAAVDTDVSLIKQSLNNLSSPEEKLEDLVRKYAELASLRRSDEQRLNAVQQKLSALQAERRSSAAARSKLETLCRELHAHYNTVREETLQRCREDEEKRKEITSQFQEMLTEIQAQIEQHSARNNKLRNENTNLTDKLESLMNQCERREESLEKINRHHDLQLKLTEAKLQQANALLNDAEEKHKREKEYLLREAIDKTKKCFAMKEQELTMKKKLALYAEKFDEFQATLGKSNEIYVRFKKEMETMSDKMKKMEKEANLWKSRFENCNKALNDMMEERTEKAKEYEVFVLKIHKLETLCHALQEERNVLYAKIKDVRHSNANLPSQLSSLDDKPEDACKSAVLTPEEVQQLQKEDPVLTEDMARLRQQQAKLQQFADSLLNAPDDKQEEKEELDLEEDLVSAAFVQFKTKVQHKEDPVSVPVQVEVKPEAAESDLPPKSEEVQNPAVPTSDAPTDEQKSSKTEPEEEEIQVREVEQVGADREIQKPAAPTREPGRTDPEPEASKVKIQEETDKLKPLLTVQEEKIEQQQATEPAEPAQRTRDACLHAGGDFHVWALQLSRCHDSQICESDRKRRRRFGFHLLTCG